MTNTLHITFTFLEQLFSLIIKWKVDVAYSNWKKNLKFSFSIHKTLLKFSYKIATSALYVYHSLKTVQEQTQSIVLGQ